MDPVGLIEGWRMHKIHKKSEKTTSCFPNRWITDRKFLYVKKGGRLQFIEIIHIVTLLGTNNIPTQGMFEDDFPVAKVGYVIVPWRVTIKL